MDCRKALEILTADDFSIYFELFRTLKKQYQTSGKIDVVQALKECSFDDTLTPHLESYGIVDYISLKNSCITTANMKSHIEMLKERSKRSRISNQLHEIMFADTTDEMIAGLNQLTEQENKIIASENNTDLTIHQKQYQSFIEDIYTPYNRKERIWTGFSGIDSCLCGLRKGSISMIGARPSTGKTAFALNVASQQIKDNKKTVFFSLEMSANQIYERLMSNILGIPYGLFNNKNLEEKHKTKIAKYLSESLNDDKFLVRDDLYNIEDITRTVSRVKPDLVIIDFVNLIRTSKKTNSRREEIDYISSEIKQTAKRHKCHIMTLSQLARASRDAKDKAPNMSDLKESGALEQDNDYIMILHRPYVQNKSSHAPEDTTLIIDKNKYGTAGIKQMKFDGAYQKFNEILTR